MALRVDYLAKEVANNLIRNPSLTIATILTVAVSLCLLGASLLIRTGVDGLNTGFEDDVEFIVWIDEDATQDQIDTIGDALDASPLVESRRYINRQETLADFQEFWEETPEILAAVDADQLPTSFRVVPTDPSFDVVQSLAGEYQLLPGVKEISFAGEFIKQLNSFTSAASTIMLIAACGALLASSLLMYNSIRTALFARRREIEVMRLVGASNAYIRIPFIFEGLILGVTGALFSILGVFALNRLIANSVKDIELNLLKNFALDQSELVPIALWLLIAGALIGALGSGLAVNRYLDA